MNLRFNFISPFGNVPTCPGDNRSVFEKLLKIGNFAKFMSVPKPSAREWNVV